jgi:D-tagatose-1,6-bisphosphate aldolase subunit GatZ/KbaZ
MSIIQNIVKANRQGNGDSQQGIYAICSAHPWVLEASILQAKQDQTPLLIEATANQVNQFGGYTGMTPAQFYDFVTTLAVKLDFDPNQIILGGDHLGPVVWQHQHSQDAYAKAHQLISDYVKAGFKKIHLDCSMACADDEIPLDPTIAAQRAAQLCRTAEQTAKEIFGHSSLVYVIGTEVPPPGGANETIDHIEVTRVENAKLTVELHQRAFEQLALTQVWPRVIALVVQPGVEFDHASVVDYQPKLAQQLKTLIDNVDHLVFEAHSTDYQPPLCYHQLVNDHFAILKVGPQLTFALREALFALSFIEEALIDPSAQSKLKSIIEQQMLAMPKYWQAFYSGDDQQQQMYRQYSYSDRVRYYWPNQTISAACDKLIDNLNQVQIPLPLISQFLPLQYQAIREGRLANNPHALIIDKIQLVTRVYADACLAKEATNQTG